MRAIVLVSLLGAAGCASAQHSWSHRYDHTQPNGPTLSAAVPTRASRQPPAVNVARCTEAGPCGNAGGPGPR